MQNDYICHYGTKGMKWGVKKATYDSMSRSDKRQTKKSYKKSTPAHRVLRKDMTDAQRYQSNKQIIGSLIAGPIGSTIMAKTGSTKDETTRNGRNFVMSYLLGPFGASTIYTK
jgi:uncharacterized protein (UPF0248 family)